MSADALPLGEAVSLSLREAPPIHVSTGVMSIDRVTNGGPCLGDMVVMGGITGHGKTSVGLQVALETALITDVSYVTLEQTRHEIHQRAGAKIARKSLHDVVTSGIDWITKEDLDQRRLHVYEPNRHDSSRKHQRPRMGIAAFEKYMWHTKSPVVMLDYARKLDDWLSDSGGHIGTTRIAQRLSQIAKDTGKLLYVLQQLNIPQNAKRPTMNDLMDSRALGHEAAMIILLWRPFIESAAMFGERTDDIVEFLVPKNRYGRTGRLHFRWVGSHGTVFELGPEQAKDPACCRKPSRATA